MIVIKVILGLLITMFLPGYLLSVILVRKSEIIERICLSIGLSIFIIVVLSFFLTAISYLLNIKGITSLSVWLSLLVVCVILFIIIRMRK